VVFGWALGFVRDGNKLVGSSDGLHGAHGRAFPNHNKGWRRPRHIHLHMIPDTCGGSLEREAWVGTLHSCMGLGLLHYYITAAATGRLDMPCVRRRLAGTCLLLSLETRIG